MSLGAGQKEETSFTAYISSEGVTIPSEIREALNIKPGDLVKCRIQKVK
jgi:bifunctional DNA-binding transcriptional regulator/antitoxin component of YhaV-PrlF toxin-antitoxin module